MGDSQCGGFFPAEMTARAGAIVFRGRADAVEGISFALCAPRGGGQEKTRGWQEKTGAGGHLGAVTETVTYAVRQGAIDRDVPQHRPLVREGASA